MMPNDVNGGSRFANPPYELKDQLMRALRKK
jgi:hypothetical protein